jgi:hypothetical protein
MIGVLNPTENFPLGCVFKLYIYLSVAEKIPPAPHLRSGLEKGGESSLSPPF